MTDKEFVLQFLPKAWCVRVKTRYRVKTEGMFRTRPCCTSERAWQAARQKILAVRVGDTFKGYTILDVNNKTGHARVEYGGNPWAYQQLWYLARQKAYAFGWDPGPWKYKH